MTAFIIVGVARSGTTLLERILDRHSKIAVCPESGIFSTLFKLGASYKISSQYQYDAFCKKVELRLMNYNDAALESLGEFQTQHPNFRGSAGVFLQKIAHYYAEKKSKIIVGEKTPHNIHYLDIIHQICPKLHYIYITRQPLDICCSLIKLRAPAKRGFSDQEVLKAAFLVKKGLWGMCRANVSERKIQIRYEDLVVSPLETLRPLFYFLSVELEKEVLNFDASNYIHTSNPDLKRIHQPLNEQINSRSVGQFEQLLTHTQISLLNAYFKKEYLQLPYSLIESPTSLNWQQKICLWQHLAYFHFRSLFWRRIPRRIYLFIVSNYFKWMRAA